MFQQAAQRRLAIWFMCESGTSRDVNNVNNETNKTVVLTKKTHSLGCCVYNLRQHIFFSVTVAKCACDNVQSTWNVNIAELIFPLETTLNTQFARILFDITLNFVLENTESCCFPMTCWICSQHRLLTCLRCDYFFFIIIYFSFFGLCWGKMHQLYPQPPVVL